MNAASNDDELEQVAENEFLGNALITAGWLHRHHAMQTLIVHDVLRKRKEPLDQFCKGLEVLQTSCKNTFRVVHKSL